MPIHLDISRLDRLVMIVILGDATGADLLALADRFTGADMIHYRKIIDITAGNLALDDDEVASVAGQLRADPGAESRGPLAFVVDPARAHVAEKFAQLTTEERPVKVFHSIHAARRWLNEQSGILSRQ